MKKEEPKSVVVVDKVVLRDLKVLAAMDGVSVRSMVTGALKSFVESRKAPTIEMEDARLMRMVKNEVMYLGDHKQRLFAVRCARRAMGLFDGHDPRTVAALDVAERFSNGIVSSKDLSTANGLAKLACEAAYESYADVEFNEFGDEAPECIEQQRREGIHFSAMAVMYASHFDATSGAVDASRAAKSAAICANSVAKGDPRRIRPDVTADYVELNRQLEDIREMSEIRS
jgi:hypothetical protein